MARRDSETAKNHRLVTDPESTGILGVPPDPEPRPEVETSDAPGTLPDDATLTAMLGSVLAWALFRSVEPPLGPSDDLSAGPARHGEDLAETSDTNSADTTAPPIQSGGATFEDVPLALALERLSTQGTLTRQETRGPLGHQADGLGRDATTLLTVAKGDQSPEAVSDRVLTGIADGSAITLPIAALLANDGHAEATGSMTFALVDGSASGGYAVVAGDTVVFTPEAGPFATGSFSYTLSEGKLTSAPVSVTLSAANDGDLAAGPEPAILLGDDITVSLSTVGNARLGGLSFGDDDMVAYDPSSDTASLLFDGGASFSNTREDIDALHLLPDGRIVLSTVGNARLGGMSFGDDDLVIYDPIGDRTSLLLDGGAVFSNGSEDINAVALLPGGLIALSTIGDATLGGLSFGDDDLVAYDPLSDSAKLLFDGGLSFSNAREDINAASLRGGELIAGSAGDDWIDGGFGLDSLDAGEGDDILIWDNADFRVEGGSGLDTLRVEAGDIELSGFTGTITGIDRIDLSGDLGPNNAVLDARDVLDISDDQAITLLGDASDRVDAGAGWSDGGLDALGYQIYTQTLGPSVATLLVDPALSVNPDILS